MDRIYPVTRKSIGQTRVDSHTDISLILSMLNSGTMSTSSSHAMNSSS